MSILSYNNGWIFFVNIQNNYSRGNLFLIPTIISMFYFLLVILDLRKTVIEYEIDDKNTLILIIILPIIGTIVQLIFNEVVLIWGSISIALLLYYIFLRELQFKYDVQTGTKTRSAFEKEMDKYLNEENIVIIVLDINNLKKTNDRYGHKIGDEVIFNAAKAIKGSFKGIGNIFRIGGDEFCVICHDISRELVEDSLSNLDKELAQINQGLSNKIEIAFGYAFYSNDEDENIYSIFNKADRAMYTHKAKLKGVYGRRIDD